MNQQGYDVAIVGASIGGCTAATLLAQRGLRVALIERQAAPTAHKKICNHYILASATPTIERLGLTGVIEAAGGVRNNIEIWNRWGWIRSSSDKRLHGYNIRRQTLDPLLRQRAAGTPGVDMLAGMTARELIYDGERVAGIRIDDGAGRAITINSRLIIGADGRHTRIGELASLPTTVKPNSRFCYFAHFRNLPLATGAISQMWALEPDIAYAFPNDDDTTVLAYYGQKSQLEAFKHDLQGNFINAFRDLPNGPNLHGAQQISDVMGMIELPNIARAPTRPGLALIGDAALALDPVWGTGCGWAFQSAEWLADCVTDALLSGTPRTIDRGLENYRRKHRAETVGHAYLIADFSTGRPYNALERLIFCAAVHDPATAHHFDAFGSRRIGVRAFLAPHALARAAWIKLTHRNHAAAARSAAYALNDP